MAIVQLGILARVDARKTPRTERLPAAAGFILKDRQPDCAHASQEGSA
jgi:hypothetical protein